MGVLGLTKEDLALAIATLYGLLAEGCTDEEARETMGLDQDRYDKLKTELVIRETERMRGKSREETYLDYILAQKDCLRQLRDITEAKGKDTKQLTALVGAVKAQSEIHNNILRTGQELGIIVKAPKRSEVVGTFGVAIAEMSTPELRSAIVRELKGVSELVKTFGDGDILDIEPGKLHRALPPGKTPEKKPERPDPLTKPKTKKTQKAKRTKRHAGRIVTKKKKAKAGTLYDW